MAQRRLPVNKTESADFAALPGVLAKCLLTGCNDAADGVARRQQDSATVDWAWRSVGRIEIWASPGDELTAADWADGSIRFFGDLGMALLADLVHMEKTTPARAR